MYKDNFEIFMEFRIPEKSLILKIRGFPCIARGHLRIVQLARCGRDPQGRTGGHDERAEPQGGPEISAAAWKRLLERAKRMV